MFSTSFLSTKLPLVYFHYQNTCVKQKKNFYGPSSGCGWMSLLTKCDIQKLNKFSVKPHISWCSCCLWL